MSAPTDAQLREILALDRLAVVGCSSTPGKAAHDVPAYLDEQGYQVFPVNPYADEVLGRESVDSIGDLGAEVDTIVVFRPSEEVSDIVDDVLGRDDVRVLWTQQGIRDDDAAERARDAGLTVVQDRCMKVDHRSLVQ